MSKQNCWEFIKCGREPNGGKAKELGVCPVTISSAADGFLEGKNGGRACMYIEGTMCSGSVQKTYKDKNCAECEFYKQLKQEHGFELNILAFVRHVKKNRFIRRYPSNY